MHRSSTWPNCSPDPGADRLLGPVLGSQLLVEDVVLLGPEVEAEAETHGAALEGVGIAYAPYWHMRRMLEDGAVELVLTEFEPPETTVHAVWPATAQVPAKTRLFVEQLAASLKAQQL